MTLSNRLNALKTYEHITLSYGLSALMIYQEQMTLSDRFNEFMIYHKQMTLSDG